jgi:hypothetical protein
MLPKQQGEIPLKHSIVMTVIVAASLALAPAAFAKKETGKRMRAKTAPVATAMRGGFVQTPPRMIEIRPGYWISSYGCVTDEGQGRLRDCSISDGWQ